MVGRMSPLIDPLVIGLHAARSQDEADDCMRRSVRYLRHGDRSACPELAAVHYRTAGWWAGRADDDAELAERLRRYAARLRRSQRMTG